jgi:hypothetical protein
MAPAVPKGSAAERGVVPAYPPKTMVFRLCTVPLSLLILAVYEILGFGARGSGHPEAHQS